MPQSAIPFLGPEAQAAYAEARAVILPLPYERTTSYGKGTVHGPEALLRASWQVELYDQELDSEPFSAGLHTLPPLRPETADGPAALAEIERHTRRHLEVGKFLVTLGGEHSLTAAAVAAAHSLWPELGVVQLDAHADLRDRYDGSEHSHACAMRRVVERGLPLRALGIRSLSTAEAQLIPSLDYELLRGDQLDGAERRFPQLLEGLPRRVYLTIDLDYFDPSLLPATGTPEPGGGGWYPTLRLLRHLFQHRQVVAMDVVELAPLAGQPASDFLAAKLVYKCLGYRFAGG